MVENIVAGVDIPVILSYVASVVHGAPLLPWLLLVLIRDGMPNLLTPNNVLELKSFAVAHDPFSNLFARERRHLHPLAMSVPAIIQPSRQLHKAA